MGRMTVVEAPATGAPRADQRVPPRPLRVLIVDDHEVVHWGLRIMLSSLSWVERCYSARTNDEAIKLARAYQPDLALVDLFVGQDSGPDICERLHVVRPGIRVLLISGAGHISPGAAAACGASGFISKDSRGADIVRAVRAVAVGDTMLDQGDESRVAGPGLSDRERQVLTLVASGATNREIATELRLSPHTVKEYVSAVYRKLEVRNRAEAVKRAASLGLAA
jgi:two-component system response regulator DesR